MNGGSLLERDRFRYLCSGYPPFERFGAPPEYGILPDPEIHWRQP
jgi:hypothetical protein